MEPKITVVAKDGNANVKIGADVMILKDQTNATFQTRIIEDFIRYVAKISNIEDEPIVYAYNKRIEAYFGQVNYNIQPTAICELEYHPKLVYLLNRMKGSNVMYTKDMELLLENLKDCLDAAGTGLLVYLKDFKQSIILDVDRQKDNQGNFINSIRRSVRGREEKKEYVFPEKITFALPMFTYDEHQINIEVDVKFDFNLAGDKVEMYWTLVNFNLDTILDELAKSYIMAMFSDITNKYWGHLNVIRQTNEWSIRRNPLEEKK